MTIEPRPLRIVDFSTHLSGPLASHLLTELGADVVKVENPRTGDGNRGNVPLIRGSGMMHVALNAGARSLAVDRRADDWDQTIAACASWADAVLVGARPKDARKRGMDFETMIKANPELIYVSLSGFGDQGPWKDYTAHGQTIDALAGLVPVADGELQPTTRSGWRTAGTSLGGVFAALGVLAAARRRDQGLGEPQYLSVSLWGAAMWWNWRDLTMLANTGEPWFDYSDIGSRYSLYYTRDRRVMLCAPTERRFWLSFCDILGLPESWKERGDWSGSMENGEGPEFANERAGIAAAMATKDLDDWVPLLEAAEIPFAPVLGIGDALASQHSVENGVMRPTTLAGEPAQIPAIPIKFGSAPEDQILSHLSAPPSIGEHTDEMRRELGLGGGA
ncbi:CoA transferase [Nocardioides sp. 31GB23]|uniref:CaiB/BaiF CoA transferase family protein n=1 Tax=Nocardioides sp. 31GB23 TaxID=3156065 RepID=UPI0032AE97E9